MVYDCLIIGGGIAGLQAAIQLGRYEHKVLVVDSGDGRSSLCRNYHNILGYPNGISGAELRETGRKQAEDLGIEFLIEKVDEVQKNNDSFKITVQNGDQYEGKRILIATGVMDRLPPFPNLYPCLGISVYICPDCDGYEIRGKRTVVIGSGKAGANMALTLSHWTKELIYINHEMKTFDGDLMKKLEDKNIEYIEQPIKEVLADGSNLQGFVLQDGTEVKTSHAFSAFGGNEVKSSLAKQLGVELLENKHILVDPRTKMTNVKHVWAAGDVVAHSEQVTIAMGDGLQSAIWIHKSLMENE